MACAQSRVWCRDTAPLCNREGRALWVLSPTLTLIFLDGQPARVEPAAGRFQEEIQDLQDLDSLESNPAHSPPKKETVPGTGPERAAELACRLVGGLSWSLWEVD